MKKAPILRAFCFFVVALILIFNLPMCSGNKDRATLIVNGETVKRAEAYIHGEYPVIPLLATLKACGYEVTWTSSDTAIVTIDTVRYTVSLTDMTMFAEGQTQNLLYVPEEAYEYTCQVSGKDILIYCYRLGANLSEHTNIKFDYSKDLKNSVIYINIKVVVDT
jgi:hypothetical protein